MVKRVVIEINGTFLLIGKITRIIVPDEWIYEDGFIDLEKSETITCRGLDSYHITHKLAWLRYAKSYAEAKEIE